MKQSYLIIIVVGALIFLAFSFLYPAFKILSGYSAKNMCSCVFIGGMTEQQVLNEDLGYGLFNWASNQVDRNKKQVKSSVFGLQEQTAVFRENLGCALIHEIPKDSLYQLKASGGSVKEDTLYSWPNKTDSISLLTGDQKIKLEKAMNWAFDHSDGSIKNTRAALIIYKRELIAEQYGEGFDHQSRMQGWSMTKSITSVLYGILYDNGLFQLNDPLEFIQQPEISIENLLQMSSGLEWEENYAWKSPVTTMLFESDTVAMAAMNTTVTNNPGTYWEYSSGTSNMLAYGLRSWFPDQGSYLSFPYDSLFNSLGMTSMIMETDASGHFVGSSYSWATARDWAKFGVMLCNDGKWNGKQIVSQEWIDFVTTPASASNGLYGGHFWLNAGGRYNTLPKDSYSCDGFNGQRIQIVPSMELVIVRLGLTYNPGDFQFNEWFGLIVDALNVKSPENG